MTDFTNTQYQNLSFEEHVRKRLNSYLGPRQSTLNDIWVIDPNTKQLVKESINYSIGLFGSIDEIFLNVVDHFLRTKLIRGKGKCTTLKLELKENGEIICYNDGEGIEVKKVENEDYYIPEMIFSKQLSGSNFNDDDGKISAGLNGTGAKLTNILSHRFEIETNDLKNKLNYIQVFENGNMIKNKPIIKKITSKDPYTKITFLLDYKYFNNVEFNEHMYLLLRKLIYTRLSYISAFMGSKYKIYYNNELINIESLYDLSKHVIEDESKLIKCTLYKKENKLDNPIDVVIGLYDCQNNQEQISFVNGIYTVEGGTHIQYINKLILENLKPKLEKKLKGKIKVTNKIISNYLFIFCSLTILNPEYTNQYKSKLKVSETRFKEYQLDDKIYKKIWILLEEKINEMYLGKITKEDKTKKSNLNGIKKFIPAIMQTKYPERCSLFLPEGDSAMQCIKVGLTSNKDLGYDYYGIFNLTGVILNVRKEIEIKEIKKNGNIEYIIDKKKKLLENERIMSLVKVLNLNWSYSYDLTPEGDKQFKELNYGKVIIAVDADVDGLGQINALVLNFFNVFFPALFKRNMISIFATPLVRCYPKNDIGIVEEFYNIDKYNEWEKQVNIALYNVIYIKGLAGHEDQEIQNMFKNIKQSIYTYEFDNECNKYFDIYFGNEPDKRKKILSIENEYKEDNYEEKYNNRTISCSYQLNDSTREFQLDNIQRKMPHIIDSLNPARRKVIMGSINRFKNKNDPIKVFQLGGYVAEKMLYHHGSDSLNKTIINIAQNFPGSRNIPLLLPVGQFGSIYQGPSIFGSPRYISTHLNKKVTDLLFPNADMNLLEYNYIDGILAEPKYFIPVLPLVLLESISLPATGWSINIFARDFDQVINNVKKIINNENAKLSNMKYFKNTFKGTEVLTKDFNMLIGCYQILNENEVLITELPPRTWVDPYKESLENKSWIKNIIDKSSIKDINIKIIFKTGELKKLRDSYKPVNEYLDYIQYNLNLYTKISHHINLYTQKNTVQEFNNYTDIIKIWYNVRKECYLKRIDRESIILRCKILMTQNIIKFIENHTKYNLSKKSKSFMDNILNDEKYDKINKTLIETPGLIKNEDLEYNIMNNNASYSYLMNLSYLKMNDEGYAKCLEKIEKYKKQLEYYSKENIYKEIWMKEIDELYIVLKDGFKNGFCKKKKASFK